MEEPGQDQSKPAKEKQGGKTDKKGENAKKKGLNTVSTIAGSAKTLSEPPGESNMV